MNLLSLTVYWILSSTVLILIAAAVNYILTK